ncbi:MAG: PorV/PorQ family protein [Candidatus Paceibacterota bacterium]
MKKNLTHLHVLRLVVAVLLSFTAHAVSAQSMDVQLPFLNMSGDVASVAKGFTGLATSPTPGDAFMNSAKSVAILNDQMASNKSFISGGYKNFNGAAMSSVAFTNVNENGSNIFIAFRTLGTTSLQTPGFKNGTVSDWSGEVGTFQKIAANEKWSWGATVRVFQTTMAADITTTNGNAALPDALGISGDASLFYNGRDEDNRGFGFGASIKNIGAPIQYANFGAKMEKSYLPTDLAFGLSKTWVSTRHVQLEISADYHKSLSPGNSYDENGKQFYPNYGFMHIGQNYTYGFGMEYKHPIAKSSNNAWILRWGWIMDSMKTYYSGVTYGAGIRFGKIGIDAAYFSIPGVNNSMFGNTFQFGSSVRF